MSVRLSLVVAVRTDPMVRLSVRLPNFMGGVSQQPPQLRLPNQVEDMDNMLPTFDRGLIKRPASSFVGSLDIGDQIDANDYVTFHFIDRGPAEQYLVAVEGGSPLTDPVLRVYDLNDIVAGEVQAKTVYIDNAARSYLTNTTDNKSLRFKTIGDVTYIVNKDFSPLMRPDLLAKDYDKGAILYVRGTLGAQNEKVVVSIDGIPTGQINCSAGNSDTQNLAGQLYAAFAGGDQGPTNITSMVGTTITPGNAGIQAGAMVTFDVSSGTDHASFYNPAYNNRYYDGDSGPRFLKATPDRTFYVVSGNASSFEVSTEPGGVPVKWFSDGTNAQLTVKGTGSSAFPGFEFRRTDNVIYVKRTDGEDFTINASDGGGNTLVTVYKDKAQTFAELPTVAPNDFILKISGDEFTLRDNYYVRFVATGGAGSFGDGVWEETIAPGSEYSYGLFFGASGTNRMPILLIRNSDGSFTCRSGTGRLGGLCTFDVATDYVQITHGGGDPLFQDGDEVYFTELTGSGAGTTFAQENTTYYVKTVDNPSATSQRVELYENADLVTDQLVFDSAYYSYGYLWKDHFPNLRWADRQVGDEFSNPDPMFIGTPILDLAFFNNRLAFITQTGVQFSEAGEFMNFFRTTVQSLLPSAPFSLEAASVDPSFIHHGQVVGADLVLSSDRAQFLIPTPREGLTPESAQVSVLSKLESDDIDFATLGRSLFIPKSDNGHTRVYEYSPTVTQTGQSYFSYEVTEQCKRFINGAPSLLASVDNDGTVALVTDTDPDTFYFYRTYARGQERVQSAWAKATLSSGEIEQLGFLDYRLYFVTRRRDTSAAHEEFEVCYMDFSDGLYDGNLDFPLLLDRKTTVTGGAYDSQTDTTTLTSPFFIDDDDAANYAVVSEDGYSLEVVSTTAASLTLTVRGDWSGQTLYIGEPYTATATLSEIVPRDQQGSVLGREFRVTDLELYFDRTAHLDVDVTPFGGGTYTYTVGYNEPINPGQPPEFTEGTLRIPVMSLASQATITLRNSSPFPSRVSSALVYGNLRVRPGGRI